MSSKRPVVLMAILLALLGVYFVRPMLQAVDVERQQPSVRPSKPAAANAIRNLAVTRGADGRWTASLDYDYTGEPKNAWIRVFQIVIGGSYATPVEWQVGMRTAEPGTHHFSTEVFNPNVYEMYTTQKVFAEISVRPAPAVVKAEVEQRIQWPDPVQVEVDGAIASGKLDAVIQKAVKLIDSEQESQLAQARRLLQTVVDKSPRSDAAYVELARIAMKSRPNEDGLREAESLLGSALQISPESANAKILLGYVYTHQARGKEADAMFSQAAASNPPNLWLWANWGELLAMQGKADRAIEKYREAIARAPTGDTYDRARWDAYWHVLRLMQARNDLAGMEPLLKQRVQEYPGVECFGVDYANFLVLQRADVDGAGTVLRDTPSPRCGESKVRLVQALMRYVAWAASKDPERAETLRQARAFQPVSPVLFYWLATSDHGSAVARQLIADGEKVGMQDGDRFDALAYALRDGDAAVARRLLRLGANPLAETGQEGIPAALIPVVKRDVAGIKLMQRAGVDYARVRYQGISALDYARKAGDTKLLEILDKKQGSI